jgi:uncharacterized protein with HEPN domain
MTRDYLLSLSDVVENMDKAQRFVAGMGYEQFLGEEMAGYAVVRCMEVVGEAVKNVPSEVRDRRPEVSWRDLAGLRDKCVHMYFGVNYRRIWQAVKEDIPRLRPLVQSLLEELRRETPTAPGPASSDPHSPRS